ncbi:hypothetical protein EYF80_043753 [Liparis tanakae]|uniref:Uncharacterized protein n=1 Tax=Liparis tanakae TaxID=230148 RepID=A0A4Z2FZR7_9TELE|nr:hypothetical protein EYF80_043753 [Liparis tanakae]
MASGGGGGGSRRSDEIIREIGLPRARNVPRGGDIFPDNASEGVEGEIIAFEPSAKRLKVSQELKCLVGQKSQFHSVKKSLFHGVRLCAGVSERVMVMCLQSKCSPETAQTLMPPVVSLSLKADSVLSVDMKKKKKGNKGAKKRSRRTATRTGGPSSEMDDGKEFNGNDDDGGHDNGYRLSDAVEGKPRRDRAYSKNKNMSFRNNYTGRFMMFFLEDVCINSPRSLHPRRDLDSPVIRYTSPSPGSPVAAASRRRKHAVVSGITFPSGGGMKCGKAIPATATRLQWMQLCR